MTTAAPILHCLEILEKEFDKSFVDLDLLVTTFAVEEADEEFLEAFRGIMSTMSSCFSQLCHKTQMTAQSNAKLEALLLDSRENLLDAQSKYSTCQLELSKLQGKNKVNENNDNGDFEKDNIDTKTEEEESESLSKSSSYDKERTKIEVCMLKKENSEMCKQLSQMENELYGTRLAAKYLDKELAGRMQQIQLLGQKDKPACFDKMWQQLEAEIHLHRHKTIVRACRKPNHASPKKAPNSNVKVGNIRKVVIKKKSSEGLGISITGGKEHGIPILISEIHQGAVVDKDASLYVGDALLSINGEDLQDATHAQAVKLLSEKVEEMVIEALYVDDEEENENINFGVEIAGDDLVTESSSSTSSSSSSSSQDKSIQSSSLAT